MQTTEDHADTQLSSADLARSGMGKAQACLDQLKTQRAAFYSRWRKKAQAAEQQLRDFDRSIANAKRIVIRERLKSLVGEPVKTRFIESMHSSTAWTNHAIGVLVKVNRKYAVVDYRADHGEWNIPLHDVIPADEYRSECAVEAMSDGTDVSEMVEHHK